MSSFDSLARPLTLALLLPLTAAATVSVAPAVSYDGKYTVSWTDASGGTRRAYLAQSLNGGAWTKTAVTGTQSKAFTGMAVGTYKYRLQLYDYEPEIGKELFAYQTATAAVQVWKSIPAAPGAIAGPTSVMPSASFALTWLAPPGVVTRYEVYEGAQKLAPDPTSPSIAIPGRASGQYQYKARACNALGCGPYGGIFTVNVDANLTTMVVDGPFTPDAPLAQGWVGWLPGEAATDGGAASYRIDVEVPPGRQGMQPQVSLGYSSRSGNGVVGVGWSLSAGGSIYRCPRTLDQDGANRPVLLDTSDRLCMGGQRLVQVDSGATYGAAGTSYRTELNPFDRITLLDYGYQQRGSRFKVEHKSGRVSVYETRLAAWSDVPDAWYLVREYDQQGNCVDYQQVMTTVAGGGQERLLTKISFTGTMSNTYCSVPVDGRSVVLGYDFAREDKRMTYLAGSARHAHARLTSLTTYVGSQAVRRYELSYGAPSLATRRSLLRQVQVCAGAACGASALPPTQFTYREDAPAFEGGLGSSARFTDPETGVVLGGGWSVEVVGDFDGDGTRDRLYRNYQNGYPISKLQLFSGGTLLHAADGALQTYPAIQPDSAAPPDPAGVQDVDFNSDGRTDLLAAPGGMLGFWSYVTDGSTPTPPWKLTTTDFDVAAASGIGFDASGIPSTSVSVTGLDYDGDGLVDVGFSGAGGVLMSRRLPGDTLAFGSPVAGPTLSTTQRLRPPRDFNGDGALDFSIRPTSIGSPDRRISFFQGFGRGYLDADLPVDFRVDPSTRWVDVNGDGLPDIWRSTGLFLNQGGPAGQAPTFRVVALSGVFDERGVAVIPTDADLGHRKFAFVMDVDADGLEEVMLPATRSLPSFCARDPGSIPVAPSEQQYSWCGNDFDLPGALDDMDRSLFTWDAYKVLPAGDLNGTFKMVRVRTNLLAPVGTFVGSTSPADVNGDGMQDVIFSLVEESVTTTAGATVGIAWYPNLPPESNGPYWARNTARAPDLIKQAVDGLGASASWKHRPLSKKTVEGTGIDPPDEQFCDWASPFYVAHNDDLPQADRDAGNVLFTSSMWAVASMRVSNAAAVGAASATNLTCYRYEDAMLNVRGRGFQGFKKIVAEERLPQAAGELGTGPGTCGAGPCSPNNLRTTTVFNQEFPFTNTPRSVTVEAVADGRKLAETTSWWHAVQEASGKPWVRYQTASTERKFDPATGTPLVTTTSVTELDLVSGEATRTCTVSSDDGMASVYSGLPAPVTPSLTTSSQETRVLTNDQNVWWLGRLDSSTTLVGAYTGSADFVAEKLPTRKPGTRASLEHNDSPETCPAAPAASRQVTTAFTWNPASDPAAQARKLQRQIVTPAGAVESEVDISFTYGSYGNPLTKTVKARAVLDGLGNRVAHTTTFGASADGYFVETEANPLGHVATSRRDAATGQVTFQQEVLGGPTVATILDALGRPLTISKAGAQPVNQRTVACSALLVSSAVACEPLEVMARQTTQAGAPTRTEYLDRLGRVLRTATISLDGSILLAEVVFNERGLKVVEFAPRVAGAAEFPTVYSGFDRLGRPARKEVRRSENIFDGGADARPLATTYTHTGHKTEIVADEGGPVPLSMSRTYDAKGRLARTVQRIDGRSLAVQYVYEPAGGLTHIVDQAGKFISASYDTLGRKTRVNDPDRGSWLYAWDGLGRLQFQTDARGRVTTQLYDVMGRPIHRSTVVGNGTPETASWHYDLSGQQGLLGWEEDSGGFMREITYDSLRRPTKVTTTIPEMDTVQLDGGVRVFTMEYGYDRNFGRLKATRYPSKVNTIGESVALDYDARGYLLGEVGLDGSYARTKAYRQVQGMSERGQVTEQRLGNCVRETGEYDPSTGAALGLTAMRPWPSPASLPTSDLTACPAPGTTTQALVRQDAYLYDRFINLKRQTKNVAGSQREERFTYDALQRLTKATLCSGANCTPTTEVVDYGYDDLGNLTRKTDYGTSYLYGTVTWDAGSQRWVRGTGNAGPHAVRQVTKAAAAGGGVANFTYDANGNLTDGDGRLIDFDLMDRPVRVRMGGAETEFSYGPTGGRYRQKVSGAAGPGFGPKTVYYVDKDYELTVWDSGSAQAGALEERTFIGGSVVVLTTQTASLVKDRKVRYQHVDRLESMEVVTQDDVGASELLTDAHGFDPWGRPRGGTWGSSEDRLHPGGEPGVVSTRGFTGHEHLDATYLIHMNGRVYDYRLGRFLSVDPIISNPLSSQAINPYSYIGNNPLSGTDPTGYDVCPAGQADKCSGAKPEPSSKPYSMVQARKDGSIAGRGGDNVTVNGFDQNTKAGQAVIAGSRSSGASVAGTQQANTQADKEGAPAQVANNGREQGGKDLPLQFRLEAPPLLLAEEGSVAARWYADQYVNPNNSTFTKALAMGGLVLSSFWTEETASTTLLAAPGAFAATLKVVTGGTSSTIYRGGGSNPGSLKLRPGEEAVSFRDSLSNPIGAKGRPVFRPGDPYIGVDTSRLPPNAVLRDNVPPGHVSVRATPEEIQRAIVEKGRLP